MPRGDLEIGLIKSMKAAIAFTKGKRAARTRTVVLAPPAPKWTKQQIARLRKAMQVSQNVFASYLNVSDKTIKAWEQGVREPEASACRLLQLFNLAPQQMIGAILEQKRRKLTPGNHESRIR